MPSFGKPDATGRSSGKRTGKTGKVHRPPKGEPWVWLTRKLVSSDAWRARSHNTVKFIDFLCVDHMNHAGTENGALQATYDQLRNFGLSANCIRDAVEEAVFLGLARVEFLGGRWGGTNRPSRYRLTFLPDRQNNLPTNEWKRLTQEQIDRWKKDRATKRKGRRNRKAALKCESTVASNVSVPNNTAARRDPLNAGNQAFVPESSTL